MRVGGLHIPFSKFLLNNSLGWWPQDTSNYNNFKFEYSILTKDTTINDLTQILKTSMANDIAIYPNPSSDVINIVSNKCILNLEIFDCFGKLVYSFNLTKPDVNLNIDISNLTKGIYYVKTSDKQSNYSFSKFIKS